MRATDLIQTVIEVPYGDLDPVYQRCVDEGFPWGCECGESHSTQEGAEQCRKCRTYLGRPSRNIYHTPRRTER